MVAPVVAVKVTLALGARTPMLPGQVPAAVPKPAAANPWTEHKTDEGVTYWYNSTTGVSQVSTTV